MIDKDKNPPSMMNYEEFNRRIEFLRLGIEYELLRKKFIEVVSGEEEKEDDVEDNWHNPTDKK